MDGKPGPDLVIFDCDGVLVDSEPISVAVLLEVFAEAGVPVGEDVAYSRFLGRSMASVAAIMEDEFGLAITPLHLESIRLRLYERFLDELMPIPGIAETLDTLTVARCVASSSQPERIALSLEITGLLERLAPHLYSSSMVKHGKPAPDLFLHAAGAMGCDPARCLVIEDSPAGVEAAQRAGMKVFAFTGGAHAGRSGLRNALAPLYPDLIFDDMRLLPSLLRHAA